jgi:hypothetical protein
MVSPPKLKREEEQRASSLWVTGELGIPTVKPPPDTRSPEGGGGEMDLVGGNKPVEVPAPRTVPRWKSQWSHSSDNGARNPW